MESQEEILHCALKYGDTLQGQLRMERENENQALVAAAWLGAESLLCFRDKTMHFFLQCSFGYNSNSFEQTKHATFSSAHC